MCIVGSTSIDTFHKKLLSNIVNEWKSKQFKDREIWVRYGMGENAFFDLLKSYSKENEDGLRDKPKIIIDKAHEERERIKTSQLEFEVNMKKEGKSLSSKKLERLKGLMNRAVIGVRRISHWFNSYIQET